VIPQQRFCLAFIALVTSSVPVDYARAQSDACIPGYVWREAFNGDHVCVTPETRERAKFDNATAADLRAKRDSDECVQGFVWRLANSEDHVCVPQITREQTARDNELAHSRLSSARPAPSPARTPALSLPPVKIGCYILKSGEWQEVPCTPQEETKKLRLPRPAMWIEDMRRMIKWFGRDIPYALPLKRASISIELESDRAHGTVADVLPTNAVCGQVPGSKDPIRSPNAFSIQVNSNTFTTSYGSVDGGWVQFSYGTKPPDENNLCVWKWDTNVSSKKVVDKSGKEKGHEVKCIPTEPGIFLGPNATGTAVRPGSVLTGAVVNLPNDPHTYLVAIGGFSWAPLAGSPFPFYAVVTTDELDDTDTTAEDIPSGGQKFNLGFREAWTDASGDIYGLGCGSTAEFQGVEFLETLTVSSCYWDLNCLQKPWSELSLQNFATPLRGPDNTGEKNNLEWTQIQPGRWQDFTCPYFEECQMTGRVHSFPR
jgi:hypothetical protein